MGGDLWYGWRLGSPMGRHHCVSGIASFTIVLQLSAHGPESAAMGAWPSTQPWAKEYDHRHPHRVTAFAARSSPRDHRAHGHQVTAFILDAKIGVMDHGHRLPSIRRTARSLSLSSCCPAATFHRNHRTAIGIASSHGHRDAAMDTLFRSRCSPTNRSQGKELGMKWG